MSAISFAKHAFGLEKPFSSITNWVDILTGPGYEEEAYDGIPELVESINIQGTVGTAEASRAIRKKIKHGDAHQQYRALVILKALVENCGHKFQTSFADGQLTDALKHLATDSGTNPRVRKKLTIIVAAWNAQYKNDSYMYWVPILHRQCQGKPEPKQHSPFIDETLADDKRRKEKEDAKAKARKEKEEAKERERMRRMEEEKARQRQMSGRNKKKRPPFNLEQERPQVINSLANASQASSNLVNAITLVNHETEDIRTNTRVQECLEKAKASRKQVVRYIQLVEDEELIGTLIETNDRIIGAIEMYDQLSAAKQSGGNPASVNTDGITTALASAHLSSSAPEGELSKLQGKQRQAVERAKNSYRDEPPSPSSPSSPTDLHPDLQDLSFGALGASSSNLPPPIRPTSRGAREDYTAGEDDGYRGGSLSDYSDYDSEDEAGATGAGGVGRRRGYVDVSDNSSDEEGVGGGVGHGVGRQGTSAAGAVEDPFADPFNDANAIGETKRW